MAQQNINTSLPNDGLGDALRDAFNKTEANFTELYNMKVDKVTGKGLSTNDYTDAEKTKLSNIATGAEVNVQSDWNQGDNTQDDFIKNKPTSASGFPYIEGGFVEKGSGNISLTLIEINDTVFWKTITNAGDTLRLSGQVYQGGDKELRTSYVMQTPIDI